jgi:hypothetical protein
MTEVLRRGVASGSAFVLSAWSLGGIVPSYPSELLGFPAALLTVLASIWPVPDSEEVRDIMVDFHAALRDRSAPSLAFRSAIRSAIKQGVSPYYWGWIQRLRHLSARVWLLTLAAFSHPRGVCAC